jgi:predicted CoA-binding protein
MNELTCIRDFLAQKRLAIAGVSREPKHFSRAMFREFRAKGYDAVPVNPAAPNIDGLPCFATVRDIQPPVNAVLLMTAPEASGEILRECANCGVKRIWIYRAGPEAAGFCEAHGMAVIANECPLMFLEDRAWFHSLHGWLRKMAGSYPR